MGRPIGPYVHTYAHEVVFFFFSFFFLSWSGYRERRSLLPLLLRAFPLKCGVYNAREGGEGRDRFGRCR